MIEITAKLGSTDAQGTRAGIAVNGNRAATDIRHVAPLSDPAAVPEVRRSVQIRSTVRLRISTSPSANSYSTRSADTVFLQIPLESFSCR
jgi:hypothetical protein